MSRLKNLVLEFAPTAIVVLIGAVGAVKLVESRILPGFGAVLVGLILANVTWAVHRWSYKRVRGTPLRVAGEKWDVREDK